MPLHRRADDFDPVRGERIGRLHEHERLRTRVVASGTLACPRCDAPVLPGRPVSPAEPLLCPYCLYDGAVRDFLSLGEPSRPARVEIRIR
jgi:hypothetical protein